MAWNKRGSTGGGASTGRDGVKRGGKGGTTGRNVKEVQFADCTTCNGAGKVTRDVVEGDEDGGFTGTQEFDCTSCNGVGRVKKG
ncbi:hypothetical protein [Parafrankia sp. EUN1f]|uniref:hypothetical protein n=1 Tax=Parafrankia sp. EUN1f TaxID=102897 RepID=UPI0001C4533D|nr:hypothetical protein [Parafrankia sp. EUN1f]EFC78925.1 hypothetical protein FrEUN1fDRAFT_7950 [Parafrankia sp. EUN1f]